MSRPRPRIHLTAPEGWLNDPLGVTLRAGRYHLFFQSVPGRTAWDPGCHWGHATSEDLLRWTVHGSALTPGDGDRGCWSGSVVPEGPGRAATMFYTSVTEPDLGLGAIRRARAQEEDWRSWHKGEVVVRAPEGTTQFRDPSVFAEDGRWRMLVGAGCADGRPAVLGYDSEDLVTWRYAGVVAEGAAPPPGAGPRTLAWECPHLLRVDGRNLLLVSRWADGETGDVAVGSGTYVEGRMQVETWHRIGHGGHYAATPFTDADGRPCLIFWIRGVGDEDAGWAGALSVPYRLGFADGHPALRPHPVVLAEGAGGGRRAAVLDWRPDGSGKDRVEVSAAAGDVLAEVAVAEGRVRVEVPGLDRVVAPVASGPVTVIVDGPILEVCTGRAVVGLPIADAPAVTITARPPRHASRAGGDSGP